ncbi:hypothetical protein GW17_00058155, partial [Ensete ventricosum]
MEIYRRNREARWEREGRSLERTPKDLPQDCRRLPEYAGNPGGGQQLSTGKPPKVNRLYPDFLDI